MWWEKSSQGTRSARQFPGSRIVLAILVALFLAFMVWQGGRMRREGGPRTVTIYCFSAMEEAMTEGILPAFQEFWSGKTGERVEFITTFAGSGTIIDRIIRRFPAEVAVLSSEIDAYRLVRTGVLPGPVWTSLPRRGVFARSPMVIRVREGNPKGIAGFEDLVRNDIAVLHADPANSGAGEWALLTVYGSSALETGDRARAADLLRRVWSRVTIAGSSARAMRSRFDDGAGDALITYEAELLGREKGGEEPAAIVVPRSTILAEPVVVRIGRNVTPEQKELIDSLISFFWSEAAQETLIEYGFRSVDDLRNEGNRRFRPIERPFLLEEIGGPAWAEDEVLSVARTGGSPAEGTE
jgi:sulfate transport system substrate-binding protein